MAKTLKAGIFLLCMGTNVQQVALLGFKAPLTAVAVFPVLLRKCCFLFHLVIDSLYFYLFIYLKKLPPQAGLPLPALPIP
jgi:hypothetical protein